MSTNSEILSLINRRRRQILVHSTLYYEYDEPIISDKLWTKWAQELENLQAAYPELSTQGFMPEAFKDFDHSTGFDLPTRDYWAMRQAGYLLSIRKEATHV